MRYSTVRGVALFACLVFGSSAIAHDQTEPVQDSTRQHQKAAQSHSMAGHSEGSMELHRIMMRGQSMPMPMSGDVDKDFAAMMTMHHRQATEMSDALLRHRKSDGLKELVREMQSSQREEIEKLAPHTR